jgi:hypothetical protein
MKNTRNLHLRRAFLGSLAVLITTLLQSCSFSHGTVGHCESIRATPVKELTDSGQRIVFEYPGIIIVYHGFGCAESNNGNFIKVEQSLDIPVYATNATVFLNGWKSKYLHKDNPLRGLGTLIGDIRLERKTLKWQAALEISDNDQDKAYNSCYYYTAIAWDAADLNLIVDHDDGCFTMNDSGNFFIADNDGTTTALSSFPTFLQNPDFSSSKSVAILPRGYGFLWYDDEHHLLQVAYNLDHSEIFIESEKKYKRKTEGSAPSLPNSASQVNSGFVSWETYAIFKDNNERRDYRFGEMVSGLGGNDVGAIQPPFSILPIEDADIIFSACVGDAPALKTQDFVIENVPYEYAIPMLTGWEMGYGCNDEHVTEVGAWIDEWSYDKTSRILSYKLSSTLHDKDSDPGHYSRHKVTILGIKRVAGTTPRGKGADLIPFSPSGMEPTAFCRIEQGGKLLRVSVKNQGDADAGASKTTVVFGNSPLTVDTPPIPKGSSVDVLLDVPANCFSPDCSFRITVDSDNQVDEVNNEGNNSANGGCIG